MGGAACPRIAQETLRRTSRMCVVACRRVQAAQRLRSRALGAGGRFAAYKAEDGGSSPSAPTSKDNILRGCDARGEGRAELQVRQKSVRKCSNDRLAARVLPRGAHGHPALAVRWSALPGLLLK